MEKRLDESRRIVRNSSQVAQEYLASLKGDAYVQYRKDWAYYGSNQIVPPNPLQINIEVTAACNLCCKMCYRNYPFHTRKGQLSLEEIEIIAQQAKELQIPSIWISGGEPTLHPQIVQILDVLGAVKPLDFWMVTNGTNLTDEVIDALLSSGLTWLSVSIDASTPQSYLHIRGGDLNAVHTNIDKFLHKRNERGKKLPFLRVSFVEMADNAEERDVFLTYWSQRADIIDIQTLADCHDLDEISDVAALESDFKCTAPFSLLSVIPNGDILPCCNGFYTTKSDFNLHNISIADYWKSAYHQSFAQSVRLKAYCDECMKCVKSFVRR